MLYKFGTEKMYQNYKFIINYYKPVAKINVL